MNDSILMKLIEMLVNNNDKSPTPVVEKGRYIVIGNRGNVVVGDLTISGDTGTLKNASVIRRWGTSRGLGQLAIDGPQPETVLDHCGGFEFNMLTTCGLIPVTSAL